MDVRLARHVRACVDGDWLIFLDLKRNRYVAVARDRAPLISGISAGLAKGDGDEQGAALGALVKQGLLVPETDARPDEVRTVADSPARGSGALPPWPDWIVVAVHAFWARSVVRRGRLLEAVEVLARAKATLTQTKAGKEDAYSAFQRFERIRVWIPHPYICLFNSLCLMRFLLHRRFAADLVFGVRARPFAAHCWVQAQGAILDDGGEDSASFVEIMRI